MGKGRLAAAYVFLVGLPLLGLLGVLRAGTHLTAPVEVRGNWTVEADFNSWRGIPCGALLADAQQPLLNVAQSGKNLIVRLNNPEKTLLAGSIDGANLTATPPGEREGTEGTAESKADCPDPQSLHLQAAASKQGQQKALTGTFSLDGCANCPPVAFRAIRQVPEGRSVN
jgi:hypothetical protein